MSYYTEQIKFIIDLENANKKGWRIEIPKYQYDGFVVKFLMGGVEIIGNGSQSLYYALLDGLSKINSINETIKGKEVKSNGDTKKVRSKKKQE